MRLQVRPWHLGGIVAGGAIQGIEPSGRITLPLEFLLQFAGPRPRHGAAVGETGVFYAIFCHFPFSSSRQ